MAIANWLNVSPKSGTGSKEVSVQAGDNSQGSTRSTSFTVKTASGLSKQVVSQQQGVSLYQFLCFYKKDGDWYCTYHSNVSAVYPTADVLKYVEVEIEKIDGSWGYLHLNINNAGDTFDDWAVTEQENIELLENFKNLTGDKAHVFWDEESGEEWGDTSVPDDSTYILNKTVEVQLVTSFGENKIPRFALVAKGDESVIDDTFQVTLPAQSFTCGSKTVNVASAQYKINRPEDASHRINDWKNGSTSVEYTDRIIGGVKVSEANTQQDSDAFSVQFAEEYGLYSPLFSGVYGTNNIISYADYLQTDTNISLTMVSRYPVSSKVSGIITTFIGKKTGDYYIRQGNSSSYRVSITIDSDSADSIGNISVSPRNDNWYNYVVFKGELSD